jgi:hypothetical protein
VNEIDLQEYGALTREVQHLSENIRRQGEIQTATNAILRNLSDTILRHSDRMDRIEASWVLQPKKMGKTAMICVAVLILFAVYGVKETLGMAAKAIAL